jgi:hypothetical protein
MFSRLLVLRLLTSLVPVTVVVSIEHQMVSRLIHVATGLFAAAPS